MLIHESLQAHHLSTAILKCLGVKGEGAHQLLGREVHVNLPAIALHHHLVKIAFGVRIHAPAYLDLRHFVLQTPD